MVSSVAPLLLLGLAGLLTGGAWSLRQQAAAPAAVWVTATLAVTPEEASVLIFAQEQGHVWLTLLPPNQDGVAVPPVSLKALP